MLKIRPKVVEIFSILLVMIIAAAVVCTMIFSLKKDADNNNVRLLRENIANNYIYYIKGDGTANPYTKDYKILKIISETNGYVLYTDACEKGVTYTSSVLYFVENNTPINGEIIYGCN